MSKEQEVAAKLDVRAYPIPEPKSNILGSASINSETNIGTFAVTGIRIVEGKNGPFVALPNTKDREGNYKDIAFPTTKVGRAELSAAVLDAYAAAKEKAQEKPSVKDQIKEGGKKTVAKPAPDKEKAAKKAEPDR